MLNSSLQVANYFIRLSTRTGKELTPMKLIKLVYISHGWSLGLLDKELIDEAVQAWKYGPVIESVYNNFKNYGTRQITEMLRSDDDTNPYALADEASWPLLDKIWEVYGEYSGLELSAMTHEPGTPWDITWNQLGGKDRRSAIIPSDLIKEHYKEKIRKATPINS